jgi:TolA-binding protein
LKTRPPSAALAAALLLSGCAAAEAVSRQDLEVLRGDVQALRQENHQLQKSLDQLATRVDALALRSARPAAETRAVAPSGPASGPAPGPAAAGADLLVVPGGLAVVKMEPPRASRSPPVPTSTAVVEPDAARLEAIARKSGRDLAVDADSELKAARRREPLARAHALEDFVARYPRHPQAPGALLEAGAAYTEAGKADAACTLDRRVIDEYPASDQAGESLLLLAGCEGRKGSPEGERRLLSRVVNDYPGSPAASRARDRLATIQGRPGADPSPGDPARSGP